MQPTRSFMFATARCLLAFVVVFTTLTSVFAEQRGDGPEEDPGDLHAQGTRGGGGSKTTLVGLGLLIVFGVVVVLMKKKKIEIWPDLVASPQTFERVLQRLGVSGFKCVDVFDATDIPSTAVAVIVLQRYDPEQQPPTARPSANCAFLQQPARGACGTLCVVNGLAQSHIAQQRGVKSRVPVLQSVLKIGSLPKHTKSDQVFKLLKECHYHAAGRPVEVVHAQNNGKVKDEEPINNHFVVFVPHQSGTTFELDSMKLHPIPRGRWDPQGGVWSRAASTALQQKYSGSSADALGCLIAIVPA